ncbi:MULTISPECIES: single-stranded DNA-binding protein [unclassified Gemella]|nr:MULTISPECIES: single-stranded DNA-binding protein [unclassified Gemella]
MLNQVMLIGRLVKKPELRESDSGLNYLKST